jgi:hypothetical protein
MLDVAIKLWLAAVIVLLCTELSFGQQTPDPGTASSAADFGGPSSVRAQIRHDQAAAKAPGRVLPSTL